LIYHFISGKPSSNNLTFGSWSSWLLIPLFSLGSYSWTMLGFSWLSGRG